MLSNDFLISKVMVKQKIGRSFSCDSWILFGRSARSRMGKHVKAVCGESTAVNKVKGFSVAKSINYLAANLVRHLYQALLPRRRASQHNLYLALGI